MEAVTGRTPAESSRDVPTLRRRLAFYLFAAARVLAGASDVVEASRTLLAMIGEAEGFCAGAFHLVEGDALRCVEVWCPPERPSPEFDRATRARVVTRGVGLAGRVWTTGRAIVIADLSRDEEGRRDPRVDRDGFRAFAAVPVAAGVEVLGVVELFGTAPREPDPLLGEVLSAVAGQLAEFVRRAAAEQARLRAEARLRTVVGNAPVVLFAFDREGRFTYGEGRALTTMGVRAADVPGRSVFDLYRDAPAVLEHVRRALAGEALTATAEVVREGTTRVYETRYDPILDAHGRVVEVLGVATDVTERTIAERALRRSEAQLLEADRLASLGALAAGVAHEINNPLAYVLLNVDLVIRELSGRDGADADLATRLREARAGVERVRLIAQDLKAFSRVDAERRVPVDVRRVIDSSIDIAANEIRHRAVLHRAFAEVPPVEADPMRLGQVFLNLLVNAVQAMDEADAGRNEIHVSTGVDAEGRVVVAIADTGAGIPAAVLPHIFEPFYTTKPAGVGTGLGLAICKSIVSSLGGHIELESEVGRGTTFRVVLPVAAGVAVEPSQPLPAPKPTNGAVVAAAPASPLRGGVGAPGLGGSPAAVAPPPKVVAAERAAPVAEGEGGAKPAVARRPRVLIVDDEPVLASALGRSIQPEFEVVVLSGGREARELLARDDAFDVVLCDLIMPAVTGMDLHEELCRTRPGLAERMIFMTGGTFTPRTREFLGKVPNPTLDKPFDLSALHALLRRRVG